jgi:hypothetical protein
MRLGLVLLHKLKDFFPRYEMVVNCDYVMRQCVKDGASREKEMLYLGRMSPFSGKQTIDSVVAAISKQPLILRLFPAVQTVPPHWCSPPLPMTNFGLHCHVLNEILIDPCSQLECDLAALFCHHEAKWELINVRH